MAYPYYPTYTQPYTPTYTPYYAQSNNIVWVNSASEAQNYPIAPNNAVVLWEKTGKSIFLKQADATGKPTLKTYDLVERAETPPVSVVNEEVKLPAYATKDELDAISRIVDGFDGLISSVKSDIETLKSDVYGIAGRKKKRSAEDE